MMHHCLLSALAAALVLLPGGATQEERPSSRGADRNFTWPSYQPDLNYHFAKDNPDFKPPTKLLDDVTGVGG